MTSLRPPPCRSDALVGPDLETVTAERRCMPVRADALDGIFDQPVAPDAKVFLKMAVQGANLRCSKARSRTPSP